MAIDIRSICKFCKLKCFKEQCRDSGYNCLSFFKVIDKESDFSSLELPSQCVEKFSSEGCRYVFVEAPSGCLYKIVLCCSDVAILKDGWQKFAASESLKLGDMVVFTVLRDTHFLVQIFQANGNEKQINKVSHDEEGKQITQVSCYADEEQNARPKKRKWNKSTKESTANEKQINKVTHGKEEEQIIQVSCYADGEKNPRPKKKRTNKSTKEACGNEKQLNKVSHDEEKQINKVSHDEEEKQIIQESCCADEEKNARPRKKRSNKFTKENFISPTFSKVLPKSAVSGNSFCLGVPSGFSNRWLPEEKIKVLLSCGSRKWSVTFDGTRSGRRFELNWKYFVVDNQLKEGDTCFFELKDGENPLEFVVKIDRA